MGGREGGREKHVHMHVRIKGGSNSVMEGERKSGTEEQ